MKYSLKKFILSIFILTGLYSCKKQENTSVIQEEHLIKEEQIVDIQNKQKPLTIADIQQSTNQDWVKQNPKLIKTQPSFFNQKNQDKYLIFEVNFDGASIPYSWDCDLSILKDLSKYDKEITTENKRFKKLSYTNTYVKWNKEIEALIWTKDTLFKTKVNDWELIDYFDCPGIISFPRITFKKSFELPDDQTSTQKALGIIPFDRSINSISFKEIELSTDESKTLKGTGYDINNDQIDDVFIYYEQLDELTGYKRLYINVDGKWTCKWIEYDEECL